MIDFLNRIDTEVFIFLNSFHNSFFDHIMVIITQKFTWVPLYLILLYMVWRVYKKQTWIILIGIILTITLADQMSVHLFKNVFHRLRPSHAENLKDIVHIVNGNRGGLYGFVSSHATNTFGLAMFLFALIRRRYKYFWWVFIWAAIVSYSRIYLGKHYPGDIICGAILGLVIGYFTSWLSKKALNYFERRKKRL